MHNFSRIYLGILLLTYVIKGAILALITIFNQYFYEVVYAKGKISYYWHDLLCLFRQSAKSGRQAAGGT